MKSDSNARRSQAGRGKMLSEKVREMLRKALGAEEVIVVSSPEEALSTYMSRRRLYASGAASTGGQHGEAQEETELPVLKKE
jgi:hypothetical protein